MAFLHGPGVGGLLEMIGPVLRLRGVQPGVLEIAQDRGRTVQRELDDDRIGCGRGGFGQLDGTVIQMAWLQVHQGYGGRRRLAGLKKEMN